jgi:iron complex outermembrane receptor protein
MQSTISFRTLLALQISFYALGAGGAFAEDPLTRLGTIVLTATGETPADTSDEILIGKMKSAAKTDTPVLETPQSVVTVTRKQIDEQNPQTVSEALRYTAGVLSDRDSNTRYDSVFLRGFGSFGTSTSYVHFLDGLKLPRSQAFAQTSIDPWLLDRLEVLKGPSAVLYGQTSPGGLVNQVSRSPAAEAFNEAFIEMGSDGRMQAGLTSRGAFTSDGRLQYSITTIGRKSDTRYDGVEEKRFAIAPALTWKPDTNTTLIVSGYYQKDPEGGYFNSLYPDFLAPTAYRSYLDRELNIGDPDFDSFEREQYGIGYAFEHRFTDVVALRSKLRYSSLETDFRSLQMAGAIDDNGDIPRQALRSIEDADGVSFDNQMELRFSTGDVRHTVLAGFDYQESESNWQYLYGAASSLNVVSPVYGQPIGTLTTIIDSNQKLRQTGVYLQDQMEFGSFRASLGLRHDWTDQDTENRLTDTMSGQSSEATSYRLGLLYLFDNGLAPYASYSTSFEPVVGTDINGDAFEPTKAKQFEVGLKYQPQGFDALFTVSAFDIRQKNALVTDPTSIYFNVQEGEIRSRGIEIEARGNVTRNLELIAALTLLDTELTETTDVANLGKRPQAVPEHFGSLWANYRFNGGALNGLGLGGGVRFVGSSYADSANTVKADGYTLVDAALRYDFGVHNLQMKGLEATLNVTNLFDKDYYSSCSSNYYCQFGNGRMVTAGLHYKW